MTHRIPLAVLLTLAFAAPAQAHKQPLKLKTIEHVALRDAYRWWHQKPCRVTIHFQKLPAGWGTVAEPAACRIDVNSIEWTRATLWHIRHDHYRNAADPHGLGAWDPYGVQTWQAFCGAIAFEVGSLAGYKPNDDPHSIMYNGPSGQIGDPAPAACGTSA